MRRRKNAINGLRYRRTIDSSDNASPLPLLGTIEVVEKRIKMRPTPLRTQVARRVFANKPSGPIPLTRAVIVISSFGWRYVRTPSISRAAPMPSVDRNFQDAQELLAE